MGKLFDGRGKFLQGFLDPLGSCFQLTSMRVGKVLVTETVLYGMKGFLISRAFRDSV